MSDRLDPGTERVSAVVTGTVTANAGTGTFTSDTELPTAAALVDGAANPTTPLVGSAEHWFNGTTWDRIRRDFATRSDTFTATGNGVTVDVSTRPLQSFSIQVKGTGAAPTTWDVKLEGSLDNINFATILTHANADGDGSVKFAAAGLLSPVLYFRSRVQTLTLGGATNIVVTILGRI